MSKDKILSWMKKNKTTVLEASKHFELTIEKTWMIIYDEKPVVGCKTEEHI